MIVKKQTAGRVDELIACADVVLKQAQDKSDGALALRALGELRELHLAKAQIEMGIDAQKALRQIGDDQLIEEVRRRGLTLDQKVTWRVVHDALPELPADGDGPTAPLPEGTAETQ